MAERVTVRMDNGVADVRLNRPEKMNALDGAMFRALVETGEALKADPSVRAVVLSGEGRSFCAGLDLTSFQAMAGDQGMEIGAEPKGDRITNQGQQAAYVWAEMPAPVIVAVHGVALGGGCQIALGGDLRYCSADATFSVLEIRWGLAPDMTGTQLLPRLVGLDVAKELTFTGRMVSGTEAVAIGLATKVCEDPRGDALALAHQIAANNPDAVRGAKALLNLAGQVSLAEGFAAEERLIKRLIGSPNQKEAVTAYFEKRPARYTDPQH
ncbi:MAG: crotonase/enoyl-CoA hydratase family protein [Acidimicrobiales bacterium]|nr:crotonase/enoyl-CoA hydratase family protein [Acidimicrobiales bacterium]